MTERSKEDQEKLISLAKTAKQLFDAADEGLLDIDTFWCEMEVVVDHARGIQTGAE